jgi:hypothetical protein
MACYEYKITFEYTRPLLWEVAVWQREVVGHDQRTPWSCILGYEAATLEGHLDGPTRLRQVLRSLGT